MTGDQLPKVCSILFIHTSRNKEMVSKKKTNYFKDQMENYNVSSINKLKEKFAPKKQSLQEKDTERKKKIKMLKELTGVLKNEAVIPKIESTTIDDYKIILRSLT